MRSISIHALDTQPIAQYAAGFLRTTNLCDSVFNNLLVRHIALVSNKQFIHTLRRVSIDLLQPLLDIVE
jgi:hypothetical protein